MCPFFPLPVIKPYITLTYISPKVWNPIKILLACQFGVSFPQKQTLYCFGNNYNKETSFPKTASLRILLLGLEGTQGNSPNNM